MKIPDKARRIMNILLQDMGARDVLIVGGFVRDSILGVQSKDVDIEVYGLGMDEIESALVDIGEFKVDTVGKAFGVLKIDNEIDVSVPRRENKVGVGHKGFDVMPDPNMSVKEAASRRDFTINSMAMRLDGEILDPFNGQHDLSIGLLRHTSEAFVEDPLRVMRAMQFAARFNMDLDPDTMELCRDMNGLKTELPKERMWEEWKKWALKGKNPGQGLWVLRKADWLDQEIFDLIDTPQDSEWHPEGDVFVHTMHVVDAAAVIAEREQLDEHDRLVLLFAALTHDFGKPSTTKMEGGRWRSKGHCQAGVEHAERFLVRIGAPLAIIAEVLPLVSEHLVHAGIQNPSDKAIRRLAKRLYPSNISMLSMVVESDHNGRPPLPKGNPLAGWVVSANELNVAHQSVIPIIKGRDLISIGVKPGKCMGVMIAAALEAQLDGVFNDLNSALKWARNHLDWLARHMG